jgi:hypothetical protein
VSTYNMRSPAQDENERMLYQSMASSMNQQNKMMQGFLDNMSKNNFGLGSLFGRNQSFSTMMNNIHARSPINF